MTREKSLKAVIRQRMAETGEPYNVARRAVFAELAAARAEPPGSADVAPGSSEEAPPDTELVTLAGPPVPPVRPAIPPWPANVWEPGTPEAMGWRPEHAGPPDGPGRQERRSRPSRQDRPGHPRRPDGPGRPGRPGGPSWRHEAPGYADFGSITSHRAHPDRGEPLHDEAWYAKVAADAGISVEEIMAQEEADRAQERADQAALAADRAQQVADHGRLGADQAERTANLARAAADHAQREADLVQRQADVEGLPEPDRQRADDRADQAQDRADEAQERADLAQEQAEEAEDRAGELQDHADEVRELADEAQELADEAQEQAEEVRELAEQMRERADGHPDDHGKNGGRSEYGPGAARLHAGMSRPSRADLMRQRLEQAWERAGQLREGADSLLDVVRDEWQRAFQDRD